MAKYDVIQEMREEVSGKKKDEYIDLGLPSGTLWKNANEEGVYTFDEAVEKFGKSLPDVAQFVELTRYCTWEWDDEKEEFVVEGPNGNSIFLPSEHLRPNAHVYHNGTEGYYWSNTAKDSYYAYGLGFHSDYIKPVESDNYFEPYNYIESINYAEPDDRIGRDYGHLVRLVKSTKIEN